MSLIRGIEGESPDLGEENPETPDDLPVGAALHHIVDKKHRKFALKVYEKSNAGPLTDDDKADIVQEIYPSYGKKAALKKANELLSRKPHIQYGLELLFQSQGLPASTAAKKLAELVHSQDEKVSLGAVKQYFDLTVPKSIKVDVRGMSVSEIFHRTEVPKPATRELHDE